MTATVAGTFATGANVAGLGDQQSGVLAVPNVGPGNITLNTQGIDSNNKVRVQQSNDSGSTWSNVSTLSADAVNTVIGATPGNQYRLITFGMQAFHEIRYKATVES